MLRPLILVILLSLLRPSAGARELVYHLVSDRQNADLNYPLLKQLQEREKRVARELAADTPPAEGYTMHVDSRDIEPLFREVLPGHNRVLTFCALEVGRHPEPINGEVEFIAHHLLVLKADGQGRIVDGFYFIREWAEAPALRLMLRFRPKDRFLVNQMKIGIADFHQLGGEKPEHFDPTGRLDNLLDFRGVLARKMSEG